jgi:hypothetical protein
MLLIFSLPVLIRHLWQLKTVIFLHELFYWASAFCQSTFSLRFARKCQVYVAQYGRLPGLYSHHFTSCNSQIGLISWSVFPWQVSALCNVMLQLIEPINKFHRNWSAVNIASNVRGYGWSLPEWSIFQVLLVGRLLSYPTTIKLRCKFLLGKNTSAYFKHL